MHELDRVEEAETSDREGFKWYCSCGRRGSTVMATPRAAFLQWKKHRDGRIRRNEEW